MRKATEILLSLEAKLDEILGYLRNNDLLLKNLSNRISKIEKSEQAISVPSQAPKQQMPGLKPGVKLGNANFSNAPQEDDYSFTEANLGEDLEESDAPKGKLRSMRYPYSGNTTVQQKIHFSTGQPAPSAKVEIFTISPGTNTLVLIDNKKTNTAGKWSGTLAPGNYIVKVFKKGSAGIPEVNSETSITVPESSDVVNLNPFQVK